MSRPVRSSAPVTPSARTLTQPDLNRALLARQLLLARSTLPIPEALEQVGGLQTQYAPSGYIGLWTRLASFPRASLTEALQTRTVVQGTLHRATIHLVSAADYWPVALGIRQDRRAWGLRVQKGLTEAAAIESAAQLRAALADGPLTTAELAARGDRVEGFLGWAGLWVDLLRVPPSGTWERRRADRLALADQWLSGPPAADGAAEDEGLVHVVRSYLRGFGPAPFRDIASWAGVSVTSARRGAASLELVRFRDGDGRELVDLPGAPLPDPDVPAPVRFLPHWEGSLLAHARRTGILPEVYRGEVFNTHQPLSVGTVLVDGRVAATWTLRDGRVLVHELQPLAGLGADVPDEVEAERAALEAFCS